MVLKQVSALHLFAIREASKGFLISLKSSNRYSLGYLVNLESALALLAEFAEASGWSHIQEASTSHVEKYLLYPQTRPRWFGHRDNTNRPPSQSYIETQYRRLKRFFNWLVQRGHVEHNPLNLILHPHIDERTIPSVSEREVFDLFRLLGGGLDFLPITDYGVFKERKPIPISLYRSSGHRETGY